MPAVGAPSAAASTKQPIEIAVCRCAGGLPEQPRVPQGPPHGQTRGEHESRVDPPCARIRRKRQHTTHDSRSPGERRFLLPNKRSPLRFHSGAWPRREGKRATLPKDVHALRPAPNLPQAAYFHLLLRLPCWPHSPFCLRSFSGYNATARSASSGSATGSSGTHSTGTRERVKSENAVPCGPGVSLNRLTPTTRMLGRYT